MHHNSILSQFRKLGVNVFTDPLMAGPHQSASKNLTTLHWTQHSPDNPSLSFYWYAFSSHDPKNFLTPTLWHTYAHNYFNISKH